MLNKREKTVMGVVYELCEERGTCLVRPVEILKGISYRQQFDVRDLNAILATLQLDDYFDMVESDKGGDVYYCVTLHPKGEAFKRSITVLKRTIGFKIGLAVCSAGVTAVVGWLIRLMLKA